MGQIRRGFSREFKVEAVRQVVEEGRSVAAVARDLEISRNLLYRWKRQVEAEPTDAFPGHGRMKPEQEELQRLRRELATVREERDFLKKTIAFFAKESE
jgi:transposase